MVIVRIRQMVALGSVSDGELQGLQALGGGRWSLEIDFPRIKLVASIHLEIIT